MDTIAFVVGRRYRTTYDTNRYGPSYYWYIGPGREEGSHWFEDYRGYAQRFPQPRNLVEA